jgi:hypothetical protein
MTATKIKKVVVAETSILPIIRKTIRITFDPSDLIKELKKKNFESTGIRNSENELFNRALYDYAIAVLGQEEVKRCLKK